MKLAKRGDKTELRNRLHSATEVLDPWELAWRDYIAWADEQEMMEAVRELTDDEQ